MNLSLFLIGMSIFAASPSFAASGSATDPVAKIKRPRLILALVIDQFRSDYLTLPKFRDHFGKMGFRYLIEKGAYFPFADYEIYQSITGPGHATILTGAYPYKHGITGNEWFYTDSLKSENCVDDVNSPYVGNDSLEVGKSPKNLITSTLGDELKTLSSKNKVVGISLKDRSAILMAGHKADLALWHDSKSFRWITSRFYVEKLPEWVESLNKDLAAEKGTKRTWAHKAPPSLENKVLEETIGKRFLKDIGTSFPHEYELGTKASLSTPYGIEIAFAAVKKAIDAMALGQDTETDILTLSISNHDYLGHAFGHQADEMEALTMVEDKALEDLFRYIQKKIPGGLDSVWITLTADHGVAPVPELALKEKLPAGRMEKKELVEKMEVALQEKFGKPKEASQKWIAHVEEVQFFLNLPAMIKKGIEHHEMETYLARKLEQEPSILRAFTSKEILEGKLPGGILKQQILNTYYKGRSGNVLAVVKPFHIIGNAGTNHMTGYSYDRMVPLVLVGQPFRAGMFATPAKVVDLAPTLAFGLGITAPASSEGRVLNEIFKKQP